MPSGTLGYDLTFDLNEFGEPKLVSEVGLIKNLVMFILFTKPGQYPSLPMIGLDIESVLYSFYDELDVGDLKKKLVEQCAALGTYIKDNTILIRKTIYRKQPSLMIHIEGEEEYPEGYLKSKPSVTDKYLIGLTFDDMKHLISNISHVEE